jgi:uncharacterized membrane protein HdeD (DUF308 family)
MIAYSINIDGVLAMYFLIDGFAGIALAVEIKPANGWPFMLLNGLLSLLLGSLHSTDISGISQRKCTEKKQATDKKV